MCTLDYVPFVRKRSNDVGYRVDTKAILQSIITATVSGLLVMYGTQKSLEVKLDSVVEDVAEVKRSINQINKDLYVPRNAQSR